MELDQFVKESLVSIARGITQANEEMNARDGAKGESRRTYFILWKDTREPSRIDFDIAVTVSKTGGGNASGKISVLAMEFGANGKGEVTHEQATRVRFPIYVEFGIL